MKVYFDNAATTMVCPEAAEAAMSAMTQCYGNPSSTHELGREAARLLDTARKNVAAAVGAQPGEIFFTSGGTEADNWAIAGGCEKMRRQGRHIIISGYEHDAVTNPCRRLEAQGWEVSLVTPGEDGRISPESVFDLVREDTALVSVMLVNNEIGAVNPIGEIARGVKSRCGALVHTDAVQGLCKVPLSVRSLGVDMMSLSSHKIHGPKGCGALYVKSGVKLPPFILGGGQEGGQRSGTEAMPAIAAFGAAAKIGREKLETSYKSMTEIRRYLESAIAERVPGAVLLSKGGAPHILSISMPGYKSEVLMNYLDAQGIYVSKSSACKRGRRSHVLEVMGFAPEIIDGALRISLSRYSTMDEAEYFVLKLKEASEKILKVL